MGSWKDRKPYAWMLGVVAGAVFLGIGQFSVIWKKAVTICLECIGIG